MGEDLLDYDRPSHGRLFHKCQELFHRRRYLNVNKNATTLTRIASGNARSAAQKMNFIPRPVYFHSQIADERPEERPVRNEPT
jgi:hypothetical protein